MTENANTTFSFSKWDENTIADELKVIVIDQRPNEADALEAAQFIRQYLSDCPIYLHTNGEAGHKLRAELAISGMNVIGFSRGGSGQEWPNLVSVLNAVGQEFSVLAQGLLATHRYVNVVKDLYDYALLICSPSHDEPELRSRLFDGLTETGQLETARRAELGK